MPRVPGPQSVDRATSGRTIWRGIWIIATRNVGNSIRNSDRFSPRLRRVPGRTRVSRHCSKLSGFHAETRHDHIGPVANSCPLAS